MPCQHQPQLSPSASPTPPHTPAGNSLVNFTAVHEALGDSVADMLPVNVGVSTRGGGGGRGASVADILPVNVGVSAGRARRARRLAPVGC